METTPNKEYPMDFETTTCGRCGGCGRYSWNAMTGDRCFGCNGRGTKLTKRGAAAREYYLALLKKPACEFVPGDLLQMPSGKFYTVIRSERDYGDNFGIRSVGHDYEANPRWGIQTTSGSWTGYTPETPMRYGATADQKAAAKAEALAYQATLTKSGTPRKS